MHKDILLMTKSKKKNGYCIAGIDVENGSWIRLNEFDAPSVSSEHFRYNDGREPNVLDGIRVKITGTKSSLMHPEDVVYDTSEITFLGVIDADIVLKRLKDDYEKYEYVYHNTYPKLLDKMLPHEAIDSPYSLMLIEPDNPSFQKIGDNRIDADFEWKGRKYRNLRVTDPAFVKQFEERESTEPFRITNPIYFVISLGEGFVNPKTNNVEYYKLIASIIDKRRIKPKKENAASVSSIQGLSEDYNDEEMYLKARLILERIAIGVNPYTNEALEKDSIYNNPETIRSLFTAIRVLDEKISDKPKKKKGYKSQFRLSEDGKSRISYSDEPIPITKVVERINNAKDDESIKKLNYKIVLKWLAKENIIEEVLIENNKVRKPTPKGEEIGITIEKRVSQQTGEYYVTLYSLKAQQFIVDNLEIMMLFEENS